MIRNPRASSSYVFSQAAVVMALLLLVACPGSKSRIAVQNWLGGDNRSLEVKELDSRISIGLRKNEADELKRLVLLNSNRVVLDVEFYGNGQAIKVVDGNEPRILVHLGEHGLAVSRMVELPGQPPKLLIYGDDGQVTDVAEWNKNK